MAAVSAISNGAKVFMAKKGTLTLKSPLKTMKGTKAAPKKAAPAPAKKASLFKKKAAPAPVKKAPKASGGRPLWLPNTEAPEWLDGTLVGDRGFDPFGLGKPAEYLQFELDALDQNTDNNPAGRVIGTLTPDSTTVSEDSLQPYNEVFDIQRFRECELIHGRWCMLATLGAFVAELNTGVNWVDAGKVELEGSQYLGFEIPFDLKTLVILEVLLMGYIEVARNNTLDFEQRCYPGGVFDPLDLASDPARAESLKLAEIKHCRLAMVAFFGFGAQAAFAGTSSPVEALRFLGV